ncbi:molybdate ABC transporter substrate-binding protein [Microlunatus soli]|uniref:Molybdate transport system substrate-binding protein n=1 Tax=Microlunatus soli TaxID=630515 RepID=A0A1H1WKA9_9ACTN|nr:molybdate ABC transporter substrate-binding protein [Microlunatus soli]SDS97100.1 molybdate transport system substrate-binding protein [Microlunatus soli]
MRRRPAGPVAVLGALSVIALAGCGGQSGAADSPSPSTGSSSAEVTGKITVLAAASLTESFATIGKDFEKAHPGSTVTFSFGSSATLATQVNQGAPADVFASADERTMKSVSDAGRAVGEPTIFATNTLQIAVPPGNPGKITGLKDFADPKKRTALCAKEVPCGAAAQKVFQAADVTAKPASYEADVKAALQKVESDEVDAALVYRTDVRSAGDKVQGIGFDEADAVVNRYPITTVKESREQATASAFVDYVTGADGQQVLQQAGFGAPR